MDAQRSAKAWSRFALKSRGKEAHSKGKETQVEAATRVAKAKHGEGMLRVAKAKQSIFERKEILQ